jgi:chromate reductase
LSQQELVVAALIGSLRRNSPNRYLFSAAIELAPPGLRLVEAPIADLPLYNADLDVDGGPEAVRRIREQVSTAAGVLFVTPEYNYSVPGALKNAIDWLSRPSGRGAINNLSAAIMGASSGRSGTMRAQLHLRTICTSLGINDLKKPEVYVTFAGNAFDAEGRLIDDAYRTQVKLQMAAFKTWIEQLI